MKKFISAAVLPLVLWAGSGERVFANETTQTAPRETVAPAENAMPAVPAESAMPAGSAALTDNTVSAESAMPAVPSGNTAPAKYWEKAFVEGNLLYEKGEYKQAAAQYESALESGYEAWELYYNLGNAHYRMVNYPEAILYYEKALKLSPKNEDIRGNLALAEAKILDRFTPLPRIFLYTWWEALCGMFSSSTWGILILIFFGLALSFLGLYLYAEGYRGKRTCFSLTAAFALLVLLSFGFGYGRYKEDKSVSAIVMESSVNVKSLPEDRSETKFILHEGSKVRIEDDLGAYYKVRAKNGSRGWIPKTATETI